jgi:hypothetical protein
MLNDTKAEDTEQTMKEVIVHLSKLLEKIEAPSARLVFVSYFRGG